MKVTIDIPDELAARWDAAELAAYQAIVAQDSVANREAMAEARRQQAAVFGELRPLVARTPLLWAGIDRAGRHALVETQDWSDRAERLRAYEAKANR